MQVCVLLVRRQGEPKGVAVGSEAGPECDFHAAGCLDLTVKVSVPFARTKKMTHVRVDCGVW